MEVARGEAHVGFVRHFFLNTPGMYTLNKGLNDLHANDRSGILCPALALRPDHSPGRANPGIDGDYDRIKENAGPGMPLQLYLPKAEQNLRKKLLASLTSSEASAAVAARANAPRGEGCLKVNEKRLSVDIWRHEGEHQKGAHFPICVFTNNIGRRSPQKMEERRKKRNDRNAERSQLRTNQPGSSSDSSGSQGDTSQQHASADPMSSPWSGGHDWGSSHWWGNWRWQQHRR